MNKKPIPVILITLAAFFGYFFLNKYGFSKLYHLLTNLTHAKSLSFVMAYLTVGIPVFIALVWMHKKEAIESVGIQKNPLVPLLFAIACTAPMFIGYGIAGEINTDLKPIHIVSGVICAGFFEELFFRGFLFGQIHRYSRLGFIPAISLGALLFASVHLYQSQDPAVLIGIFMTTLLGAVFFAWVYVEWNYNLWVPIFLHMLMNLSWALFEVAENAYGNNYANIFRIATIAAVITSTVVYKRRTGRQLAVNYRNLLRKSI